ncbi:TPA: ATP-binding protein [Haemophilus influenzae]|nr:hypothetical protein TA8730_01570 [Haemophilus influenzae]
MKLGYFFIMMSLVITVPNFDLRIYSPLKEANIVNYQKEINIRRAINEYKIAIMDHPLNKNDDNFYRTFTFKHCP